MDISKMYTHSDSLVCRLKRAVEKMTYLMGMISVCFGR